MKNVTRDKRIFVKTFVIVQSPSWPKRIEGVEWRWSLGMGYQTKFL